MSSRAGASVGRCRRALTAGLTAVLVATGVALTMASTASAAPVAVTGGALDWGVKASFRSYVTGPIASGSVTLADGATLNPDGTYHFPAAASSFDAESTTPTATFTGSVHFVGHGGLLDITIANLRVQRSGSGGTIVADVTSVPFESTTAPEPPPAVTYTGVELVTLSGGTYATAAASASWSGAASVLTVQGAPAFGGFYPTDTAFDPASFALTLDTGEPEPPSAVGALTWKLSQQAWTSSSLVPAHAAGDPATLTPDGWVFPASAAAYDPSNGATTLTLGGSLTIGNTNQGGYRIVLANPSIAIDASGAGTLQADVSSCTSTANCASPGLSAPVRVVVVTFTVDTTDVTDTGSHVSWTITPDYSLQNDPANPTRRQFPQSFLDALPASLQGHFRDTGSATADPNKPPAPLSVAFDYTPEPPTNGGVSQEISTEVLVNGGLTISVTDDSVTLPSPTLSADGLSLVTSGAIHDVTVTDLRLDNPGWNVHGQLTDFTSSSGTLGGQYLGWTPDVISHDASQTVTAGATVLPGSGGGLTASSLLGQATAGAGRGTAVLGAGLQLKAPTDTPPGVYTALLTLTAI